MITAAVGPGKRKRPGETAIMTNQNVNVRPGLPENWGQLSPGEKREHRLNNYLNTQGIDFVSRAAEEAYQLRTQRMVAVLNVQEPDMVPVNLPVGNLPLALAGPNSYTAFYEQEKTFED